tara:strand:- start:87 stop:680 length:594 start_codon:yes stop_codon:yes gene_type:complete
LLKNLPKPRKSSAANQERISFRAQCEALSIRQFDVNKIEEYLRDIFDFGEKPQCVYCDDDKNITWDHLVPVTPREEGDEVGHSITGNLVTACSSCNTSKKNYPFEWWLKECQGEKPKSIREKSPTFVAERISKLECYKGVVKSDKKNKENLEKLEDYKGKIKEKTKKIETLRKKLKCALEELEGFIKKDVLEEDVLS